MENNENSSNKNEKSRLPPADGFNVPLMNTWTNNKFINKRETDNKKQNSKNKSFRPRSGNPSPTKMYDTTDKLSNTKIMFNYNHKSNLTYMNNTQQKSSPISMLNQGNKI